MPPANRKNPIRAASSDSEFTLMDFMREFPDDDACLNWLWRQRYSADGTNAYCPKCQQDREFARYQTGQQRQSWTCKGCGYHQHPTAGTIFHKSSTSLHLWFYAMYLMTSTRCGISAKQLERELGVTYKTAWRMMNLIRKRLMRDDGSPLSGNVEMDEMYVGGRPRGRSRTPRRKTAVFGMVERKGRVVARVVPSNKEATLMQHVEKRVLPASTVFTDEAAMYQNVGESGYFHKRIKHAEQVYVSGDIHTNTIEGFWSLTKRGISGVYHAVSAKHLQGYLNEYVWRYNERDSGRAKFSTLLRRSALY